MTTAGEFRRSEVDVFSREALVDIETLHGTHIITSPAIIHGKELELPKDQESLSLEIEWFTANAIAKRVKKSRDVWVMSRLERFKDSTIEKLASNGKPAIHYPFWAMNILIEEALTVESYPDAGDYYSLASLSHAVRRGEPWLLDHLPLTGIEGEMRLFGDKRPAMAYPPEIAEMLSTLSNNGNRTPRLKYKDAASVLGYFKEKFPDVTITLNMMYAQLAIDISTPSRKNIYDYFGSLKGLNDALLIENESKPIIEGIEQGKTTVARTTVQYHSSERDKVYEPEPDEPADSLAWLKYGLCAQTDPEAFFPEQGGSLKNAKKVCAGCEVKERCLQYALETDQRFGVWGGLGERELRKLRKLKKNEAA